MTTPSIVSFDDIEMVALLAAARELPIECRDRFLIDVVQALAVIGGRGALRMIERLQATHLAACMGRIPGDHRGDSELGTAGERRAVGR